MIERACNPVISERRYEFANSIPDPADGSGRRSGNRQSFEMLLSRKGGRRGVSAHIRRSGAVDRHSMRTGRYPDQSGCGVA